VFSGNIRTPFCYAVDIGRSPIVKSNNDRPFSLEAKAGLADISKKNRKLKHSDLMHSPVAYSLAIHSPIVIVKLLPEGGRFELMR